PRPLLTGPRQGRTSIGVIFKSPYPDVALPDVPLHQFVLRRAAALGDKPALVDAVSGRSLTYAALAAGVARVAGGLAARGFRPGDVLGVFMPNAPEFALAFHGTLAAGGVVTTINSLCTVQDAVFQLRDARARFLVTVPPFMDRAGPVAQELGIEEVFVIGGAPGTTPFAALLEHDAPVPHVSIDPAADLAVLPYSSGTTGFPKGVMLTHRNLVANLCQVQAGFPIGADDTLIGCLPFFHIYGMTVILNQGMRVGATIVTMPRFDLEPFLGALQRY